MSPLRAEMVEVLTVSPSSVVVSSSLSSSLSLPRTLTVPMPLPETDDFLTTVAFFTCAPVPAVNTALLEVSVASVTAPPFDTVMRAADETVSVSTLPRMVIFPGAAIFRLETLEPVSSTRRILVGRLLSSDSDETVPSTVRVLCVPSAISRDKFCAFL